MNQEERFDVIVFGSGMAGLVTALAAAKSGCKVVICEKAAKIGGTSATSAGTLWVPANDIWDESERGSRAEAERYLRDEIGPGLREDLLQAFLDSGSAALTFLNSECGAKLLPSRGNADYHATRPGGAVAGRAVVAAPLDARTMGDDFQRLRPPHKVLTIFGGMMIGRRELPDFLSFYKPASALRVGRLLLRHGLDRTRYNRGTRLMLGNALIGRLLLAVRQAGIEVRTETRLDTLLAAADGRIVGAVTQSGTGKSTLHASRGVVLATGGFPGNLARLAPRLGIDAADLHAYAFPDSTGDAIDAATGLGAAMDWGNDLPALFTPVSVERKADGTKKVWAHHSLDRGKPGCIAVTGQGRRFVNEAGSYHDFVVAMLRATPKAVPAYLICDRPFLRRYGLGLVRPIWQRPSRWVRKGYLLQAPTIAQLADQIGADGAVLEDTVKQANRAAELGVDPQFGRGESPLDKQNGDPSHGPNSNLGPILHPPFFALPIYPGVLGTSAGLTTDADGRVLDGQGAAMPGLFACGSDAASFMRGSYPGPGINLGPGTVFAYRAGLSLAGKPTPSPK